MPLPRKEYLMSAQNKSKFSIATGNRGNHSTAVLKSFHGWPPAFKPGDKLKCSIVAGLLLLRFENTGVPVC